MNIDNYLTFVAISFFTITSPGAAILLAINNGIMYDTKAVLLSTLGNILGLFILSGVAMLGVGAIFSISSYFFLILKIIGAIYLIFLGMKQILNKKFDFTLKNEKGINYESKKVFQKGFLVAITNPKPILFFSAIFPLFLKTDTSVSLQFFIMTFTFMFISFLSLMFYGTLTKHAKTWFFDMRKIKIFYKISGSLFILMGIGMLFVQRDK